MDLKTLLKSSIMLRGTSMNPDAEEPEADPELDAEWFDPALDRAPAPIAHPPIRKVYGPGPRSDPKPPTKRWPTVDADPRDATVPAPTAPAATALGKELTKGGKKIGLGFGYVPPAPKTKTGAEIAAAPAVKLATKTAAGIVAAPATPAVPKAAAKPKQKATFRLTPAQVAEFAEIKW